MKEHEAERHYALVTGGSDGIGFAISEALARRGYHLLLVALPDDRLELSAGALRQGYGCEVYTMGIDLRHDGADLAIAEWVKGLNVKLKVLVNNAGFGHLGPFGQYDRDFYHGLLQVNMLNVVGLTRLMLEPMQNGGSAWVLNVGSIASFFPIPYKTVYSASKGFLYTFSRALREELRDTGVQVSILCPGPVLTNEEVRARIQYAGRIGQAMALDAGVVGEAAVRQMLRGKYLLMPGAPSRLAWYTKKVIPTRLLQRLLANTFRKKHDGDQI